MIGPEPDQALDEAGLGRRRGRLGLDGAQVGFTACIHQGPSRADIVSRAAKIAEKNVHPHLGGLGGGVGDRQIVSEFDGDQALARFGGGDLGPAGRDTGPPLAAKLQGLAHRQGAFALRDTARVIDPYGGQTDLRQRVLRHVTRAFAEDPW